MERSVNIMLSLGVIMLGACGSPPPPEDIGIESVEHKGDRAIFSEITGESGIDFHHYNGRMGTYRYPEIMGGGVALFDYDSDGLLDIYFVNGNNLLSAPSCELSNHLYRNEGDLHFSDVTDAAGVGDINYGQGCCVADYDNDGDQDLYVTNYGDDRFFVNNGDGTFEESASRAGIENPLWGQTCAFLDIDNDGWLDLYVQNYLSYDLASTEKAIRTIRGQQVEDYLSPRTFPGAPDIVFRNNRDGTFSDITKESGMYDASGRGMGAACADFDTDNDTDIIISNDGMENYLYVNDGSGHFHEDGLAGGIAYSSTGTAESSMGVDIGDVDGDGLVDLLVPVMRGEIFTLYHNEGGFFRDISIEAGLAEATNSTTGFSPNLIDYDNDMDLDIFVTCGGVSVNDGVTGETYEDRYGLRDMLLRNDGRAHFDDVSSTGGEYFARRLIGRGSAAGDLDNDGDIDLVINNLDGPAIVLRNDYRKNCKEGTAHWLTISLLGTTSNREGIGARIEVEAGGRVQTKIVRGGGSYLSNNDRRLHFGLGGATEAERITVHWPSGTVQSIENIEASQFLTIEERP